MREISKKLPKNPNNLFWTSILKFCQSELFELFTKKSQLANFLVSKNKTEASTGTKSFASDKIFTEQLLVNYNFDVFIVYLHLNYRDTKTDYCNQPFRKLKKKLSESSDLRERTKQTAIYLQTTHKIGQKTKPTAIYLQKKAEKAN